MRPRALPCRPKVPKGLSEGAPLSQFHTDQPISGGYDSPDLLNREEYARRVGSAALLDRNSPGIVVSIEGPWGYGKTSVLNLINKYFNTLREARPIIFNFNPWMVGTTEDLVQRFLVQFASAINASGRTAATRNAVKRILAFSRVISAAVQAIPNIDPKSQAISKILGILSKEVTVIVDRLTELNIDQRREEVVCSLQEVDKPIVVFIDDLDRLPPVDVFQMVRLVKAVADFPRVAYIIAFDFQYIEQALNSFGIKDSRGYIDKLVQVRLHLPLIDRYDLVAIFDNELRRLGAQQLLGRCFQRMRIDFKRSITFRSNRSLDHLAMSNGS